MASKKYGYIRVSTKDQNEARQVVALEQYAIPKKNLYADRQSGKDFDRPAWRQLLKRLRPGDLLIVKSIDRLGRNYEDILEQWRQITKEVHADILVVDMPLLDTRAQGRDLTGTFIADLVLQILSYVAQTERESIRQRQAEGIAAAKARGVKFGHEPKPLPADFELLFRSWRTGGITMAELERRCGLERSTIYRRIRELGIPLGRRLGAQGFGGPLANSLQK